MLDDLDRTLEQLLIHELPDLHNATETSVAISFAMPVDGNIQQKPAINLFLYDVRENLEFRNREWSVQRQPNGTAIKKRLPPRVDCSYLITAWAHSDDAQQEHHLLGKLMKLLLRYRTLPSALLQGSLKGQEPPLAVTGLQPGYISSSEFWQAIGGKPKLYFNYTITLAVPLEDDSEEFPLVLENRPQLLRIP